MFGVFQDKLGKVMSCFVWFWISQVMLDVVQDMLGYVSFGKVKLGHGRYGLGRVKLGYVRCDLGQVRSCQVYFQDKLGHVISFYMLTIFFLNNVIYINKVK